MLLGELTMNTVLKIVPAAEMEVAGKRDYINRFNLNEPKQGVLFRDFIILTVNRKAKRMAENYSSNYNTLIHHLNKFSELNDADIFTNSVNEAFIDDFITYLEGENLKLTYIKTLLSLIKAMAKKAGSYGYAVDSSYDDVNLDDEDIFTVYLSMNEITRIYYYQGLSKKQERIRDLFVLGCLTAMRYSDYSTLTSDNMQGDFIVKITKKTGKKVIVPMHDYVKEIIRKYNGIINFGLSNQHFNRYIKVICQAIGITDPVTFNYTRGGKLVTETRQKWELISSHTARRSAATNMYLTQRMQTFEIMQITGHTTEKSFFRYIRITGSDSAKQIAGDNFFRK